MKLKSHLFFLAFLSLLCLNSISANSKIYIPPQELLEEVKVNKIEFDASPNATTAFNLAMSYAYTGQIEKGWSMLSLIPDYDSNYAPKVINTYTPLIEKDPKNWKYHFKIAFGYYFKEDKKKSIESFKKVLVIDPNHIWAMGFIALLKGELDDVDSALEYCKRALKIEPNATAIHFLIAEAYRRKEDYFTSLKHVLTVGRLKAAEKVSALYDDE